MDFTGKTEAIHQATTDSYITITSSVNVYDVAKYYLILVSYPVVCILGIVGNILSFCVMSLADMRKSSTSVFLASLALGDTAVLLYSMMSDWYGDVINLNFFLANDVLDKLEIFWLRMPTVFSAWVVVSVCGERLIVTWLPLKAASICRRKHAYVTVCVIFAASVTFGLASALRPGAVNLKVVTEGEYNEDQWSITLLYSFIPSTLLLIMSILISVKLKHASLTNQHLTQEQNKQQTSTDKATKKATRVVLAVCVAYIVLTLPAAILLPTYEAINAKRSTMRVESNLVDAIAMMGIVLNHCFNFVLYVVTSSKFRKRLSRLFCGKCRNMQPALTSEAQTTSISTIETARTEF